MSRRKLIGFMAVAMIGGCGGAAPIEETGSAIIKRCPDPTTDCTVSNGTGVYTDEEGFAGIGDWQLMITNFVNTGTTVNYHGRYYYAPLNEWFPATEGTAHQADYAGESSLWVRSVSESNMIPTFILYDYNTGISYTVTGADLVNLTLHLGFNDPDTGKLHTYELRWAAMVNDTTGRRLVRTFNMTWRELGQWTQYCFDIDGNADPVSFFQGFSVNPVTADVVRNSNTTGFVTLSCRQGAMDVVHSWGYPDSGSATFYFDSGLHMKGDRFCGDSRYFTKKGQKIYIKDDLGFNHEPVGEIEAYWDKDHALCYGKQRYPALPFDGHCQGFDIPKCDVAFPNGATPAGHWLEDGPL